MIRPIDRKIAVFLVRQRFWRAEVGLFRVVIVMPCKGTRWLFERMLKRQNVDEYKHAPCCPANHWCRRRLVFQRCNCGAVPRKGGAQ